MATCSTAGVADAFVGIEIPADDCTATPQLSLGMKVNDVGLSIECQHCPFVTSSITAGQVNQ